jgi:hypothetical protein
LIKATASLRRSPACWQYASHQRPTRRGPGEAGLGDGKPGGGVALEGKRLREPLHRAQRDVLGPRTLRQLQRTAGFVFCTRPFARAVRDVAAAPGCLGSPRVTLATRRQGFGERQHGLDVLQLQIALSEQLQRALARGQQSPAQRAVVGRRQYQRPRRAVECLLVCERGCVVSGGARIEFRGVRGVAGLLEVLGGGRQQALGASARVLRQPLRRSGMGAALVALEQSVVGDLVQYLVAKDVLAHAVLRIFEDDQIPPAQRG